MGLNVNLLLLIDRNLFFLQLIQIIFVSKDVNIHKLILLFLVTT